MSPRIVLSIITTLLCISGNYSFSQSPSWKWAENGSNGNVFQSVTDSSGNTIILGRFSSNSISFGSETAAGTEGAEVVSLFLVKYNSAGQIIWLRSIMGTSEFSELQPVKLAVNDKGEIAVLGNSLYTDEIKLGPVFIGFQHSNRNAFVLKLNKVGRVLWGKPLISYGSGFTGATGRDLTLTSSGDVVFTGSFIGDSAGMGSHSIPGDSVNSSLFLSKINTSGVVDWLEACAFETNNEQGNIEGNKVAVDEDNTIYLAGNYSGARIFSFNQDTLLQGPGTNIFIVKYSSEGQVLLTRSFIGDMNDSPENLIISSDGMIFCGGMFNSRGLDFDDFKIASSGDTLYDAYIAKFDDMLNTLWAKSIAMQLQYIDPWEQHMAFYPDGPDDLRVVISSNAERPVPEATTIVNPQPGTRDISIFRLLSETGDLQWIRSTSSQGNNYLNAVTFDEYGNTYLSGDLISDVLFADNEIYATGYGGFFLTRINSAGDIEYIRAIDNGSNNAITSQGISTDKFGNVYLSGNFSGADIWLDELNLTNSDDKGVFLGKFGFTSMISGTVRDDEGIPVTAGYLKLLGHTRFQRSPLSDSIPLEPDGSFVFNKVPMGRYIITAIPDHGFYPGLMKTYYPSTGKWEDADKILITSTAAVENTEIILNRQQEQTGEATLGGYVSEIDSIDVYKSTLEINAKPIKKRAAILISKKKTTGTVIASTTTDNYGNFAFYNVNSGEYILLIDMPGMPHDSYYDVTVTGGELIMNLDYLVGEETISTVNEITGTRDTELTEFSDHPVIFPNPSKGQIHLLLSEKTPGNILVEIFDLNGNLIYRSSTFSESDFLHYDFNHLQPSAYTIRIITKDNSYTEKLIIH